ALRELAAEEDLLLLVADGERTDQLAHSELRYHPPGEAGSALDIVSRPCGDLVCTEDDLFSDTTTEEHRQAPDEPVLGVVVPVHFGKRRREAKRTPARDDGHLMNGIAAGNFYRDDGVTSLVIRRELPLGLGEHEAPPLHAEHHLVLCV